MTVEASQTDRPPRARIPVSFPRRPILIGSEIYRRSRYGVKHPLSIQRVTPVMDLAHALGLLSDDLFVDSPMASPEELSRFHAPDYIAAVVAAERDGRVSDEVKEKYNIGRAGNPVFPEIFSRPATAAGASLLAGRTLASVERGVIHSLAGGTHHGRRDMAYGFCFFNDPVLGILAMLDSGLSRVAYVDLDAHHGDGVQDAFHDDDRVLTVSIHEDDRWPRTGSAEDRAGGMARNFPAPKGLNDSEFRHLIEEGVVPLVEMFAADAVVIQSGCDGLADDPQSKLELSNNALFEAVRRLSSLAPRVLVVGGGGYNPWAVARCWTGIWATLNGQDPRDIDMDTGGERILRELLWNHSRGRNPPEHWFTTLADRPNEGDVRAEVVDLARLVRRPG
ncbi:acetoin utilization protein AcuC [Nisaea sp.]|uniref:acetoin utilization protein AcuC n=1 Tax=Nisaea sp. TaxID=2024842 RepID=UPI003B52C44F